MKNIVKFSLEANGKSKISNREKFEYNEFDDLKKISIGIANAKISCGDLVRDLENRGSVELSDRYKNILNDINEIFIKLKEDLNDNNIV